MITRRDVVVAVGVCFVMSAALAWAQSDSKEVMRSMVFDFQEFEPQQTDVGQLRHLQAAHGDFGSVGIPYHDAQSGDYVAPTHQHPNEEVIILTEGELEVFQNGNRRRIGPGSVMFMASNELHGVKNVGEKPATYYVINWHSPGMLPKSGD